MMELIDTHCHIQSAGEGQAEGEKTTRALWAKAPKLNGDQMVSDATAAGVTSMICVGCDLADSQLAINFAERYQQCWASIGIHPHEAKHHLQAETRRTFTALATAPKVVAIGECGLDYYYNHSPKDAQIEVLNFQLELATRHKLPAIFHVRQAFDDFWAVLDRYPEVRGVLHSYTDSAENLQKALKRNLYIGVNGIATFSKDPAQLEVYRSVPLQKLLLETDAPFLTPVPYRGSINEPKRVRTIAEFLANLRGEDRELLASVTTNNARQLFGLIKS